MAQLLLSWRANYLRYATASIVALAVGISIFTMLAAIGLPLALVSALGYVAGIGAYWLASNRIVFTDVPGVEGAERGRRQMLFLLSAGAGLATTVAIVTLGGGLGVDPVLAKFVAIGVSFQLIYLLRSRIVFV